VARVAEYCRFYCFTHGSLHGHNGTQGLSRFSNPGRFGYSTFPYPVQYSYKRGLRTSLLRPYQYLLDFILPFLEQAGLDCCSDAECRRWGFPESRHFLPGIATSRPGTRRDFADMADVGSGLMRGISNKPILRSDGGLERAAGEAREYQVRSC
jgi:hypothetical protein